MKFTIEKDILQNVLAKIQGLAGKRTNMAITTGVLIKADSSGVKLTATDLETGYEGLFNAEIEKEGIININARKLFEIIRDFPHNSITVEEIEERWIEISNEKVEYHIVGMEFEDFPTIPKTEEIPMVSIQASFLRKMIDQTIMIHPPQDDKREHINGVYFETLKTENEKDFIRFVSTDGKRMTKSDCIFDEPIDIKLDKGVLIPKKGLAEAVKFIDVEGEVRFGVNQSHAVIEKENEFIIIRLLEGEFPEYKEILNFGDYNVIMMERQLFLMMLKRMSILNSDNFKGVVFNFNTDQLLITVTNPDLGKSKEDMTISYSGDSIKVAFNPRYFIETLNVIDDDYVNLMIKSEEHPCIINGEIDKDFVSVIMPMRI